MLILLFLVTVVVQEAPIPPCIQRTSQGALQIALEVEDRAPRSAVIRVSMDDVKLQVKAPARQGEANSELLERMSKVLRVPAANLSLLRGWSNRSKLLMVQQMQPHEAYKLLQDAATQH